MGHVLAESRDYFSYCEDAESTSPIDVRQRKIHESIYFNANEVGVDLLSATNGQYITHENLLALNFRGYLDVTPSEIYQVFYDLDDYNSIVRSHWEEDLANKKGEQQKILDEIAAATDMPDKLFHKLDKVWSGKIKKVSKINKSPVKTADIGVLVDEPISDSERIHRYTKYRLAQHLLTGTGVSSERLMGISIGIFLSDSKPTERDSSQRGSLISSFQSEIRKVSQDSVTQADVELAADSFGWFDYIYPQIREKYLKTISDAAREPIVIPLDNSQLAYRLDTSEVSIDVEARKLLIGETAVRSALEKAGKPENIHKLGELLVRECTDYRLGKRSSYEYKNMRRHDYIDYGKWLLKLVKPYDKDMTARLITTSNRLGLGPGVHSITNQFGNLRAFYESSGAVKKPKGRFAHWQQQQWLDWLDKVETVTGENVTKASIREYSKKHPEEPTLRMLIKAGGINYFRKAANRKAYNEKMTAEECVSMVSNFVVQNGRMPKRKEYRPAFGLPSLNSIYIHCGGMVNVRKLVEEYQLQAAGQRLH